MVHCIYFKNKFWTYENIIKSTAYIRVCVTIILIFAIFIRNILLILLLDNESRRDEDSGARFCAGNII